MAVAKGSTCSMETGAEEKEPSPVVTLVDAIMEKYCSGPEEFYNPEVLPVFRVIKEHSPKSKPGASPVEERKNITVDDKGISESGPVEKLLSMCPKLTSLHMTNNLIKDWEAIFAIILSMPLLENLNLTLNRTLSGAASPSLPLPSPHGSLVCLQLSCTGVPFKSVVTSLPVLPNLSELHLSCNQYTDSDILQALEGEREDDGRLVHHKVSKLYFVENQLSQWFSVECIGALFPNLLSLILNSNPLQKILLSSSTKSSLFRVLESINLNDSQLDSWDEVERLGAYPRLRHISLLRLPFCENMTMKESRFAAIARLPLMSYLNKSIISGEERQDAERWFLREYKDHSDPPDAYRRLLEKHGNLEPLVQVSLEAPRVANMTFTYEGIERPDEVIEVDIMQTTRQFRRWIGRRILVPPSKLRVYYNDDEGSKIYGGEELRIDSKALYTYRMKDGDKIEVYVQQ